MVIMPTQSGGRRVCGKVGKRHHIDVEWSADGEVVSATGPACDLIYKAQTSWGDFDVRWKRGQLQQASVVIRAPDDYAPPAPYIKGVGDHMKDIVLERAGNESLGCNACREMIQKMNAWGPDGCEQHADEIVDHLLSQVDKLGKLTALAVRFIPGAEARARKEARAMLAEAITRTRNSNPAGTEADR